MNTPQWQLNLLARFPRPLAVVLIGFITWFIDDGIVWLVVLLWCFGLPVLIGLLAHDRQVGAIAFVLILGGTMPVLGLLERFAQWYGSVDQKLPKRDRSPDEDEGGDGVSIKFWLSDPLDIVVHLYEERLTIPVHLTRQFEKAGEWRIGLFRKSDNEFVWIITGINDPALDELIQNLGVQG